MLWEILLSEFSLLTVSNHLVKFKRIFRADPDIYACVVLGYSWPKLPIWPKREFSGQFHFSDLCLFIAAYHAAKFEIIF